MRDNRAKDSTEARGDSAGPTQGTLDRQPGQDSPLGRFLAELLALQCHCCRAKWGAVLQADGEKGVALVALHPAQTNEQETMPWLQRCAAAAEKLFAGRGAAVLPAYADQPVRAIAVPLPVAAQGRLLTMLLVKTSDKTAVEAARQLLELTVGLVGMTQAHLSQHGRETALQKLQRALEILASVNRQNRLRGAAMAFCNEVAAQYRCERVSIGFLKGRYVQMKAMSHTEHFSRKMRLVQDIEAAMEECLDQDCEVLHPAPEDATYISRAAREFSNHYEGKTLLSLSLRQDGQAKAVVSLERSPSDPFTNDEIEAIRLSCDLCASRLLNLYDYDRWFGARLASQIHRGLAKVVGPQYAWAKLTVLAVSALVIFLIIAKGWYRVKAPFSLEAVSQYKVTAPFDGYIKEVGVEVGDHIVEDVTALAELDTVDLRLQLASAKAEQAGYLKQADAAMRDGKTAEAQIAQASADKSQAQIDLLAHRISQAMILSPVTGTLVTGDLKRQIGAPVETGKILFEVAPLDSLRAELYIPEDEVFEIAIGQQGRLATATYPAEKIRFIVERVNPAAEVVNNRNVFKVRARLLETQPWMRPGMEGVAKVTIEKRRFARIWTRKIVNWVRMKLWL